VNLRQIVQQSHLRGVLSAGNVVASATPIVPVQRAPFALTRPESTLFYLKQWIKAKCRCNIKCQFGKTHGSEGGRLLPSLAVQGSETA